MTDQATGAGDPADVSGRSPSPLPSPPAPAPSAGVADLVAEGASSEHPVTSTVGALSDTDPGSWLPSNSNVTVPVLSYVPQSSVSTVPMISRTSNTPSGTVGAKQSSVVPVIEHTFEPEPRLHSTSGESSSVKLTLVAVPGPAFSKVTRYETVLGAMIDVDDTSLVIRMSGSGSGGGSGHGTSTMTRSFDRTTGLPTVVSA